MAEHEVIADAPSLVYSRLVLLPKGGRLGKYPEPMKGVFLRPTMVLFIALMWAGCQRSFQVKVTPGDATGWTNRLSNPKLTQKEFLPLFGEALLRQLADRGTVVLSGPMEARITLTNGHWLKAFAGNAWRECAQNIPDRPAICLRYANISMATLFEVSNGTASVDTNQVLAVVRDTEVVNNLRRNLGSTNAPLVELLAADLWIVYVVDQANSIRYLTALEREGLPKEPAALRALALANSKRLLPNPKVSVSEPINVVTLGGTYESSLLLNDDFWEGYAGSIEGEIVAVVPTHDALLFTGSKTSYPVQVLKRLAGRLSENEPHPLSTTVLVRRDHKWEEWKE